MPARPSLLLASGGRGATLVGATAYNCQSSTNPVAFPMGTKAGDLAIIGGVTEGSALSGYTPASITGGAGGWSKSSIGDIVPSAMFIKVLVAGDLGGVTISSPSFGGYTAIVAVYRDATGATLKSTAALNGSEVALPGFTKSPTSLGLVSLATAWSDGSTPVQPPGFKMRAEGGFPHFSAHLSDMLFPNRYSGGVVVWSDFLSTARAAGRLIELT